MTPEREGTPTMPDTPKPLRGEAALPLFWRLIEETAGRDYPMEFVISPETARALLAERAALSAPTETEGGSTPMHGTIGGHNG